MQNSSFAHFGEEYLEVSLLTNKHIQSNLTHIHSYTDTHNEHLNTHTHTTPQIEIHKNCSIYEVRVIVFYSKADIPS